MRIALLSCTDAERAAVAARIGPWCTDASPAALTRSTFDVAIVGTAPDHAAAADAARRAELPCVVLLKSADDYLTIGDDVAALAPGDLASLPHVVRRESARAKRNSASATSE